MKLMQRSLFRTFLVTVGLCLLGVDTANAEITRSSFPTLPVHPQSVQPGLLTAKCEGTLTPDRATIVGGITAESLKPLEAKARLEKQLAEIDTYVSAKHGKVSLLETVRAIRQRQQSGQRRGTRVEPPFILLQRVEFEFPRSAEIDGILERLLQLGFDRYGKTIRP